GRLCAADHGQPAHLLVALAPPRTAHRPGSGRRRPGRHRAPRGRVGAARRGSLAAAAAAGRGCLPLLRGPRRRRDRRRTRLLGRHRPQPDLASPGHAAPPLRRRRPDRLWRTVMTGIDEMLRSVLADDAQTQPQPFDLAAASMRRGRRLRHRRRAGFVAVTAMGVAAIVGGSLAVASQTAGDGGTQHVVPAAHGGSSPAGNQAVVAAPGKPWWRAWPTGRTWGRPAPNSFLTSLAPGDHVSVYASGQMNDGTEFALYLDSTTEPRVAQWMEDWRTAHDDFGESTQRPAPRALYLAFESPTHSATGVTQHTQWLIVAG